MPLNQRYGRAFLEWYIYGSSQTNQDMQEQQLEKQEILSIFSESLYAQLIESLGNQTVEKLLESLAKFERCDNVQAALKFNLLMMFQAQFQQNGKLAENTKSQVQSYISSSRFLDIPII